MDAISPEKRLNRLVVLSEHIRADIDIFCLLLRLQEIVHEPVESQYVFEIHHPGRTGLHGDKCNRYRRRVASKNREQLLERIKDLFWRSAGGEVIISGINHNCPRFPWDNEAIGKANAVGQFRSSEATIEHRITGKVLLERFPEADR